MRIASVIFLFILASTATALAAKETCKSAAGWCIKKGGTQANCFEAQRMASCKASGTYMAPNGRAWPTPGK